MRPGKPGRDCSNEILTLCSQTGNDIMPSKPCRFPGCPELLADQGRAWCSLHSRTVDNSYNRAGDKLYDTKRWRVRSRYFLSENPECYGCSRLAQTVDHIVPYISESVRSFWDQSNWQPLCLVCHGKKTRHDIQTREF